MVVRKSYTIESYGHSNPIATVTRIGPLVTCSIIGPRDPGQNSVPDELDAQIANLFTHVGQMLDAVGGTWDDVAKMTFYVKELSARAAINPFWAQRFTDPDRLPSRHTQLASLEGKALIQCDFTAYIVE
jgi:2-iminobutanoate/2-iminopropanoate deaminase